MIKKLQKLFSSLIVSSDVNHLVDRSYAWFITDDKKLIGILKTELTDKDMALLSTFLQPYNTQFPLPTVEEEKWKQIVEKTDESTDISCQAPYRFIYFSMNPNQITPSQFKEAIQELFSREVPILWQNSHEGILIEEQSSDVETISYDQIIDILMSDLYVTIKFFVGPYHEQYTHAKQHYNMLIHGAHTALAHSKKSVVTYVDAVPIFFINETSHNLRTNISETILQEFIHDGETLKMIETFLTCNLNISETAKELYMHRNSLQYRLDRFYEKTKIDVRQFHEAMSVYLALLAKDEK